MVSGFSTASYLKVHVKTHHSSSMLPSSAAHQFPEPRSNRPQTHNGAPYHSGRQCAVEGKQASPHSVKLLLAHLLSFSPLLIRCCICLHINSPQIQVVALRIYHLLQHNVQIIRYMLFRIWQLHHLLGVFSQWMRKDVCY